MFQSGVIWQTSLTRSSLVLVPVLVLLMFFWNCCFILSNGTCTRLKLHLHKQQHVSVPFSFGPQQVEPINNHRRQPRSLVVMTSHRVSGPDIIKSSKCKRRFFLLASVWSTGVARPPGVWPRPFAMIDRCSVQSQTITTGTCDFIGWARSRHNGIGAYRRP